MRAARTCIRLKSLFRLFFVLLAGFAATICGCFGIALFVFAGRWDWGAVFILAPAVMISMDPEEMIYEFRRLARGADREV